MGIKNWWNTIKMAWGTKQILTAATKEGKTMEGEIKPGWKTTEFWGARMTQIASLVAMGLSLKYKLSPEFQEKIIQFGMGVIGLVETGYSISRGIAKKQ